MRIVIVSRIDVDSEFGIVVANVVVIVDIDVVFAVVCVDDLMVDG